MTERAGRHSADRGHPGAPRLPRPRQGGGATGDGSSQPRRLLRRPASPTPAADSGVSPDAIGRVPEQAGPGNLGRDQGDSRAGSLNRAEPFTWFGVNSGGNSADDSSRRDLVLGEPVVRGRPPAPAGPPAPGRGGGQDSASPGAVTGRPTAGDDRTRLAPRPPSGVAPETSRGAAGTASRLRLIWVYPDLLSTYGDRGNLLVLQRRARLRGIEVEPVEVNADQSVPVQGDIYLIGGGEDLPQILAANRLRSDGGLAMAARHGRVVFAVCAGYQVMGHEFGGVEGEPVEGLGLLDITSGRGQRRGVGELVADVVPELGVPRLTGFENHQGTTRIGPGARPLATVSRGVGNGDGTEGAFAGRVLGTYMHGPALARNPGLADLLLTWAAGPLAPIDPTLEEWATRLRAERLATTAQ